MRNNFTTLLTISAVVAIFIASSVAALFVVPNRSTGSGSPSSGLDQIAMSNGLTQPTLSSSDNGPTDDSQQSIAPADESGTQSDDPVAIDQDESNFESQEAADVDESSSKSEKRLTLDDGREITYVSYDVAGKPIWVPAPWKAEPEHRDGSVRSYRWVGDRGQLLKVDVQEPADSFDIEEIQRLEERRLASRKSNDYKLRRLRLKSDYLGGIIWNFQISRDGQRQNRTIVYLKSNDKFFAVLVSNPDSPSKKDSQVLTEILNSIHDW